jgi:polyisoprenoid-binding protein YceI
VILALIARIGIGGGTGHVFEYTGSAKDPFGNSRAGFEGKATVNRKDWGLNWNSALETGGFLVSGKIVLEVDVSAVKLTATP